MASLPLTSKLSVSNSNFARTKPSPKLPKSDSHTVQENGLKQQTLYRAYFHHISALCKEYKVQEAVDVLTQMGFKNFCIGPEIYGEILQGCVYERALSTGQQIHARVVKQGAFFNKNNYIETKLVIFYAKCDAFDVAMRLFDDSVRKNVFSWAAIIGLHCRVGRSHEALLSFCAMYESGVLPDNFILPNALKACGALQLVGFGRGLHACVLKMGFGDCVFVASSLVDMYGKCGVLGDSRKILDGITLRNVVVWNSMISSYVQNGLDEKAIETFYDMRVEGIEPARVAVVGFFSASANLGAVEEGKQGHALVVISGLKCDNILGSSLINFYSKIGLTEDAEKIFNMMSEKDVVTWNLLISCYVQYGSFDKALNMCRLMRSVGLRFDAVTLASILSSSADMRDINLGKEGHCYSIRNYLDSNIVVANGIVDAYAKHGNINYAKKIFDSVPCKDVKLWNTLLIYYAELGYSGEALKLFYGMQLEGVPPSVISWNAVIWGFLKSGFIDEAKDMFTQMQSSGVSPNLNTWNILISGLAQNGLGCEAVIYFNKVLELGIQPSTANVASTLSACSDKTLLRHGRAIHCYSIRSYIWKSILIATALVEMYAKCGCIDQAEDVFDMVLRKELPLYNAMISCYACHGRERKALSLFHQLQEESIQPDEITFTAILSMCNRVGLVDEGFKILVDMLPKYHVKPSSELYGCIANLLSHCDNLNKGLQFIYKLPFDSDPEILESLLAACHEYNNSELAEYLSKNIIRTGAR